MKITKHLGAMHTRRTLLVIYWVWLTIELLLSDPWTLFGEKVASQPPLDVHTSSMSMLIHWGTFAVLASLIMWVFENSSDKRRRAWLAVAIAYGWLTEFLQQWIPHRWPGLGDAAADTLGIFIGAFLFLKFRPIFWNSKLRQPQT